MGIFDIVGPVMIGPSSSHTAGAARIGLMARKILKDDPVKADITVYGSFAKPIKDTELIKLLSQDSWGLRQTICGSANPLPLRKKQILP